MHTRRSNEYEDSRRPHEASAPPAEISSEVLEDRWSSIKARFVDDPRGALDEALGLVDDALDDLVQGVRSRCDHLRGGDGDRDATTEELRRRLHECRSVVDELIGHPLH